MGLRNKQRNHNVGQIIKSYREKNNLTQKELGEKVDKGESTVRMWELGKSEPDIETLCILSKLFKIDMRELLGLDSQSQLETPDNYEKVEINEHRLIPLLGSVVAGVPIESQEDIEGYIYIDQRPVSDYFALRVNGQSMKNVIPDRSIIIVRKQETADNGDIVVAMLNGEQTVKRFKRYGDIILLSPENQSFDDIPVTPADDFLILGKVVEIRIAI